jgi:hypothetical protein
MPQPGTAIVHEPFTPLALARRVRELIDRQEPAVVGVTLRVTVLARQTAASRGA